MGEEKNQGVMWKRPDCYYCKKAEVGFTFVGGQVSCGECFLKYEKEKFKLYQENMKKEQDLMMSALENQK